MHTKSMVLAAAFAAAGAITVGAQQQPADPGRTPGVQAGADPKRAEFLMDHGFIDRIVPRKELRSEISRLIDYTMA